MYVENGKLVLGRKDCWHCEQGTVSTKEACKKCQGSGRGPRGGRRTCKPCYGQGHVYNSEVRSVCPYCHGQYQNASQEDYTDALPNAIWDSLPFRVYRHNRSLTVNESLLGLGCVFSCQDYGRTFKDDDNEKLIAEVCAHKHHQACKVVQDDGTLADHIGIFVSTGGYSVRPVFESAAAVVQDISRERSCDKGIPDTLPELFR